MQDRCEDKVKNSKSFRARPPYSCLSVGLCGTKAFASFLTACALASVLVAGSSAAEGVQDGQNGILIEANAGAMASAILCMTHEPEAD